jgi:hypothetical protein
VTSRKGDSTTDTIYGNGGGNSITYDHCYVTNILPKYPIDTPISLKPLKVLSVRSLPY